MSVIGIFRDGSLTATDDKSGSPNSATVNYYNGDLKITGLVPGGREVIVIEGPEGLRSLRAGKRVYPQLTFSGDQAELMPDFDKLVQGQTSGFVSVTSDIGDQIATDIAWSATYGTSTREGTFDDCVLTGMDIEEGSPSRKSYTFTCYGPVTLGGETIIASR